jgi:hypothetical protein
MDTSLAILGYLKVEFFSSEKIARILRSSGFFHFFGFSKFHLYVPLEAMRSAMVFFIQVLCTAICGLLRLESRGGRGRDGALEGNLALPRPDYEKRDQKIGVALTF